MRRFLLGLLLVGAATAVVASGCGSTDDSSKPGTPGGSTAGTATSAGLAGSNWVLQPASLGVAVPSGVSITAAFTDAKVGGNSGCNNYSGTYTSAGAGQLQFGPVAGTMMACDPAANTAEQTYLAKLPKVQRFAIAGDVLTLSDSGGTALLVYDRARTATGTTR